jgi:hypothetical protein
MELRGSHSAHAGTMPRLCKRTFVKMCVRVDLQGAVATTER